ncbi:glycosyltransferase family 4 protein [Thermosynechococcaceae cyanobacterium BACA0444]|uniref:Glycosyltransferase family 4 protein n=1 Tax=Pseudocalidococcus azoricus BACA0444 TaxID=2918990 RepID=A0AAE4JWS9_9CYAN|nr:glycosyltransferase family 4 protein [Pseudocalidococcus azoricus]MDS3859244.1 glycosyltransferase family 4 protein [Pseudocalidococcus azoricus BACA0444]
MKILLVSYTFFPNIGGIEAISELLATNFVALGHEVIVVTHALDSGVNCSKKFDFQVIRRPNLNRMLKCLKWCDVLFQNNISLLYLYPNFLYQKPCVIAVRTWIQRSDGQIRLIDKVKLTCLRFSNVISISKSVADSIKTPSVIIGNPYNDKLFRVIGCNQRIKDLVFLGRLVSDKGVDTLISALKIVHDYGIKAHLSIIGDGSERLVLESQVRDLNLERYIIFEGVKSGQVLVSLLNQFKIMVVPSRWAEPFGIVALEGIACGCVVVGSEGGGLKDAIGLCGLTFPNGDHVALANALIRLLSNNKYLESFKIHREEHLKKHSSSYVVQRYLNVLINSLIKN